MSNNNQRNEHEHRVLLYWLLMIGLLGFALVVLIDMGILQQIIRADVTRITSLIFVLFVLSCCHCGYRSWFISRECNHLFRILAKRENHSISSKAMATSLAQNYINAIQQSNPTLTPSQQAELLAESIRGTHKVGWFVVGVLVKLGLLGTVIGFVMMLGTVSDIDSIDVSDVKQLMQQMTQGMGIAMYTTMFGLIGSMLLGAQYLFLERSADRFVSQTLALSDEITSSETESADIQGAHSAAV